MKPPEWKKTLRAFKRVAPLEFSFLKETQFQSALKKLVEAWQFLDSYDVTKFLKRLADIKCLANIMGILKNIVSYRLGNPHNNLSHVSAFHLQT